MLLFLISKNIKIKSASNDAGTRGQRTGRDSLLLLPSCEPVPAASVFELVFCVVGSVSHRGVSGSVPKVGL